MSALLSNGLCRWGINEQSYISGSERNYNVSGLTSLLERTADLMIRWMLTLIVTR